MLRSDGSLDTPRTESRGGAVHQAVRSPEQVVLEMPIAGPTSRMLAYGVDMIFLLLIFAGMISLLLLVTPAVEWLQPRLEDLRRDAADRPDQVSSSPVLLLLVALMLVLQFVIETGYFIFWEMVMNGRSPGKVVAGLRVTGDDGRALSLRQSVVRNLLRIADMLPNSYLVGFIVMLMNRDGKRLGDLAAGTIVVRLDRPAAALPLDPGADDESPFRFNREQIAALGSVERELLRQTLRRIDGLATAEAEPILVRTSEALRVRIGYEKIPPGQHLLFLRALLRAMVRGNG